MRLPYGIYKAAQAEALRQRKARALDAAKGLTTNAEDNIRLATEAIDYKYSPNKRLKRTVTGSGAYSGRGAYSVSKFARDFRTLIPKSVRDQLTSNAIAGLSGQGAYSGRGDYNNLFPEYGRPSMYFDSPNDETQSIVISHCEYLQDVFGAPTTAFTVEGWNLNPALLENFPWLSQIAANYEEYEFIQLLFHFKSTVDVNATNNSNGATGTIIMATNYNPTVGNFANKETMMQYHGANSGRLVEDHTHGVECDPSKNAGTGQKYTRVTPVVAGQDLKSFDLGRFQIAQVNTPAAFNNQQIGELWVTYTVKLTKPRLFTSIGAVIPESRWTTDPSKDAQLVWQGIFGESNKGSVATTVRVGTGTGQANAPALLADYKTYAPSALLSMQMNMINCQIMHAYTSGSIGTIPYWGYTLIYLPDFLTGVYEITLMNDGAITTTSAVECYVYGSVIPYADMLGVNGGAGDLPSHQALVATAGNTIFRCRVQVNPITTGVDNCVVIAHQYSNAAAPTGNLTQVQLSITQVQPYLGQSSANSLPLYVNSSGIVTAV